MKYLLAVLCVAMAGCAHKAPLAPRVVTERVDIPVVQACVPADTPPAPAYADADLRGAADPAERIRKVGAANLQRKARLAIIEPIIAGCR